MTAARETSLPVALGRPETPRLFVALRRPDPFASSLIEQLRSRMPVRVRTMYRKPLGRARGFKPLTKRRQIGAEALFLLRYLTSPSLYGSRWRFLARHGHYATLAFGRLLRLFGQRRRIYLINFYIHDLGRNPLVKRILRFLLTDDVYVLAQTRSDERYFLEFLPPDNVTYVPYCQGESAYVSLNDTKLGEYVFAGGMVNRDYDALFRCAEELPALPFTVVASTKNRITGPVPSNVTLLFDLPPEQFDRLLAECRFVVIPLKEDVGSSGQMVLLKAMSLAKAVVMPRLGAVVDYVEPDRSAVLYELGDQAGMKASVGSLSEDPARLSAIGEAAREAYAGSFTPARFLSRVVAYVCGQDGSRRA